MNQIVSNYNNGEDPHLKPLNEFYSNWCKKHNGDMSALGCHNIYLLETTDREGNVTKRAFALNVTTWKWILSYYTPSGTAGRPSWGNWYIKSMFIGSDNSTDPTTNDTTLNAPITSSSANITSDDQTRIEGSTFTWDSTNGLLKANGWLITGYFDYVMSGISDTIHIREIGLSTETSDGINKLATHALVYDSEGNKSEITKDVNEKLTISAYVTIYHKPGYIENNLWTNKGYAFAINPWAFFAFGYASTGGNWSSPKSGTANVITHTFISSPRWQNRGTSSTSDRYSDDSSKRASTICRVGYGCTSDNSGIITVDNENQIITKSYDFSGTNTLLEDKGYYYDLLWVQLVNQYSSSDWATHYCSQAALVKPIYLPEPEEIVTDWAWCESVTSDSLTVNFGHATNSRYNVAGLLPITNMQVSSLKSYNGLTHDWDIDEPVLNASNTYNLTMYALYPFVGIYMNCPYYEAGQIRRGRQFVRIYFNLFPEVPITSISTSFISASNIWCSDQYWNTDLDTQGCWERIPDPTNIPPALGCKRYYIGFSGSIDANYGPDTRTQPLQITRAVAPTANGVTIPMPRDWDTTVQVDSIDTLRDNGTNYYYRSNQYLQPQVINRRRHIANDDLGYIWMSYYLYYPDLDVSWLITSSEYGNRPDPVYSLRFANPSGSRILQFFRNTGHDASFGVALSKVSIFEIPDAANVDPSDPTTYTPNEIVMTIEGLPSNVQYANSCPRYFMTPTETGYVVIVNPSTNRTHIINIDGDEDSSYAPYNYILKYPGTDTEIVTSKCWAIKYTTYVVYYDPNITTDTDHGFTIQDLATDTIIDQFTISKSIINNVRWIAGWKTKLYITGSSTSDIGSTWRSYLYDLSRSSGSRLVDQNWSNDFSRSICPGSSHYYSNENYFNWFNLIDPYTQGDESCIIFSKSYKSSGTDKINIWYLDEIHADSPLDINTSIGITQDMIPNGYWVSRPSVEIIPFNKDNVSGEYKQKVLCFNVSYYGASYYTYFYDLMRICDDRKAPERTHSAGCPYTVSTSTQYSSDGAIRTICAYKGKAVISEYSRAYTYTNPGYQDYRYYNTSTNKHRFVDPNRLIPHRLSGTTRTIQAYNNPKRIYGIKNVTIQIANSESLWDPSDLPE